MTAAAACGLATLLAIVGWAVPPAVASSTPAAGAGFTHPATVRLITGETVTTREVAGRSVTTVRPAPGESGSLVRMTTAKSSLAVPTAALRYLGTVLDPSLFDVSHVTSGTTVHVSSPRATTLSIPGLNVLNRSTDDLSGTFDAKGSVAFGAALRAQAAKDRAAGKTSTTLFGATRISLTGKPPTTVKPSFAQVTMRFSVLDRRGRAADSGALFLMNLDDPARFASDVPVVSGQARASLPKGRYTVFAVVDEDTSDSIVTVPQFTVTTNMQLRRIDARLATARVGLKTARPTSAGYENTIATWHREVEGADWGMMFSGSIVNFGRRALWIAPTAAPTVGSASWSTLFVNGSDQQAANPYTYWAAFAENGRISGNQLHTLTRFATVDTSYLRVARDAQDLISRTPLPPDSDSVSSFGWSAPVSGHSTDYLAAPAGSLWQDDYTAIIGAGMDFGFGDEVSDLPRVRAPGVSYRTEFLRGPLASGVPAPVAGESFGCNSCRSGNDLYLALVPVTDTDPGHLGSLTVPDQNTTLGRASFWQDGRLISSQTNQSDISLSLPARDTTIRARVETWPSRNGFTRSTHAVTELTFHTSATDPLAPSTWDCQGPRCRVPGVLVTSVPLPTRLDSTMSVGSHPFTFTVAPITGPTAAVVTATFAISLDDGRTFTAVPVRALGGNRFEASLSNPASAAGKSVTIRVSGRTPAGATITQTTDAAYVVTKA